MNQGMLLQSKLDDIFLQYRLRKLGIIDRVELPAIITKTGVSVSRSTVDYVGHFNGIPVAFDAKECKSDKLNIKTNLKDHQIEYLKYWSDSCNGKKNLSGFIIYFYEIDIDHLYVLDIQDLRNIIDEGAKSIDINEKRLKKFKFDEKLLQNYFNEDNND